MPHRAGVAGPSGLDALTAAAFAPSAEGGSPIRKTRRPVWERLAGRWTSVHAV